MNDLKDYCRVCLATPKVNEIFEAIADMKFGEVTALDVLNTLLKVKVSF